MIKSLAFRREERMATTLSEMGGVGKGLWLKKKQEERDLKKKVKKLPLHALLYMCLHSLCHVSEKCLIDTHFELSKCSIDTKPQLRYLNELCGQL